MEKQKSWINLAQKFLSSSLSPLPHELNELDWKLSLSEDQSNLCRHISAFANHRGGGFFAFGLTAQGETIGINKSDADQIIRKIANVARDGLDPPQKVDHHIDEFQEKAVLFIYIAESPQKPVHMKGKGVEFSYLRSGGQTRKMSPQEIANAVLNSRQIRFEDMEALSCHSQDLSGLLDVQALYQLLNIPIPESQEALIEQLVNQKMIYRNNGNLSITNLGVIVAAKDLRIFQGRERFPVRVIKYTGTSRIETEGEKEFYRGYGVGFQELVRYIMGQLPTSEVIQDALRKNVPLYPEMTVRELVANALIHRDFTVVSHNPMVEIFADRMEISNPGLLLPSVQLERIIDSAPESRNEIFASFMRRLGICEERGSGIDKALFAVELYGLPPIEFLNGPNVFKATIYRPKNFKQMSPKERLNACYQHCCLRWVSSDRMTNNSFRKRLGLTDDQYVAAWRIMDAGVNAGLIKPAAANSRARKYAQYIPFWA